MLLGYIPTSRNAMCYDSITRETKSLRHFVVDESHFTGKTDRTSYAKDLLLNYKDKLKSNPKSFESNLNHHAVAATAIHRCSEVMHSDLHLTDTHDSPSFKIKIPIKGHHPTLGLDASTTGTGRKVIDAMSSRIPA